MIMSRMPPTFESNAPIFTVSSKKKESDAIAEQTRKFLSKKGSKIQHIEKGLRTQPFIAKGKRTAKEIKAAWSNNKVHDNKGK